MRLRPRSAASVTPGSCPAQRPGGKAVSSCRAELTGNSSHGESPRVDTAAVAPQHPHSLLFAAGCPTKSRAKTLRFYPCFIPTQGVTPPPDRAGTGSAPSPGHVGDTRGQGEGTGTAWDLPGCGRLSLRCQQGSAASKAVSKAGRKTTSVPPAALRLSFPREILIEIFNFFFFF